MYVISTQREVADIYTARSRGYLHRDNVVISTQSKAEYFDTKVGDIYTKRCRIYLDRDKKVISTWSKVGYI